MQHNTKSKQVDQMEIILGGVQSSKVGTKEKKSTTKISIAINRPGFPIGYINMQLVTDLSTGLSELGTMDLESVSAFAKNTSGHKSITKRVYGKTAIESKSSLGCYAEPDRNVEAQVLPDLDTTVNSIMKMTESSDT